MHLLSLAKRPLILVPLSLVGIFYCAWRMDQAAKRLDIEQAADENPPETPKNSTILKNMLLSSALLLIIFYVFNRTTFLLSCVLVLIGCVYLWREAYKSRIKPLVQAGLTRSEALSLTAMQALWIAPLGGFVILHLLGKYGAL